jgi:hypothetical protein
MLSPVTRWRRRDIHSNGVRMRRATARCMRMSVYYSARAIHSNSGWNMNRIATQTITFSPPPASSQSSISLPLDEVFRSSGFGRDAEAEVQPSSRPAVFCPLH